MRSAHQYPYAAWLGLYQSWAHPREVTSKIVFVEKQRTVLRLDTKDRRGLRVPTYSPSHWRHRWPNQKSWRYINKLNQLFRRYSWHATLLSMNGYFPLASNRAAPVPLARDQLAPFVKALRLSRIFMSASGVPSWKDPNHLSQGSSSPP